MYRYICKRSWALADRDQAWQVSDTSAECLKVINSTYLRSRNF